MNHNVVFVLDAARRPLTPCRPARARQMLRNGKAAIFRRFPFTIILKDEKPQAVVKPMALKIDPGARVTGLALVDGKGRVLFGAEVEHRGAMIKDALLERRAYRRSRRSRKTRYRAARFDNRRRPEGWLAPSLRHRVETVMTWVHRLMRGSSVSSLAVERVKFDLRKMQNAEIRGVQYQRGELFGYQVREYLLEKFGHRCVYCDAMGVPLEIEHVVPESRGGSDRVSNLAIACRTCNEKKGNHLIEEFLKASPELAARIKAQIKAPLRGAAAVNATRNALFEELVNTGLPVETGTGAETKCNRTRLGLPKEHWIDAACVGISGATITLDPQTRPLRIKACGHGVRQRSRPDRYGFPRPAAPRHKRFAGFQTGDIVRASIPSGNHAGYHTGRVAIRHRPSFHLTTDKGVFDVHPKYLTVVQKADGYAYR